MDMLQIITQDLPILQAVTVELITFAAATIPPAIFLVGSTIMAYRKEKKALEAE